MSGFGAKSTTDDVLADIDLTGKTVFITGGTSGLGLESARAMAIRGADIIIAGRSEQGLKDAASQIQPQAATGTVETIRCDLTSLDSIRSTGQDALHRFEKIDLLINNAGVMACPFAKTTDGFEMQFGTNHLGHFLLTTQLMPLLEQGTNVRIVNLSSRGHHMGDVDLDDPNYTNREYERWPAYGQSKTANVLFTVGLEKRLADRGIHALAVHPGGIGTNLGRHLSEEDSAALIARITANDPNFAWKTIPQGAATQCWAATAPELEGKGGVYCEDCHIADIDNESAIGGVRSYALDAQRADRLWTLSEELVGEQFPA